MVTFRLDDVAPTGERLPTLPLGDRSDRIVDAHRRERPELASPQAGMALVGDAAFRMPAVRMAEALSKRGVPVHMYLATVTSPDLHGILGAPHAIELPFLFGALTADGAPAFRRDRPTNAPLSDTSSGCGPPSPAPAPPRPQT